MMEEVLQERLKVVDSLLRCCGLPKEERDKILADYAEDWRKLFFDPKRFREEWKKNIGCYPEEYL